MRLLIVGATGRTGEKVTEQALARGHNVMALVHRPSLKPAEGFQAVVADPCNIERRGRSPGPSPNRARRRWRYRRRRPHRTTRPDTRHGWRNGSRRAASALTLPSRSCREQDNDQGRRREGSHFARDTTTSGCHGGRQSGHPRPCRRSSSQNQEPGSACEDADRLR